MKEMDSPQTLATQQRFLCAAAPPLPTLRYRQGLALRCRSPSPLGLARARAPPAGPPRSERGRRRCV
jgi:hypothetical protein